MTGQNRSKVAPRRPRHAITGLLLHSRALHRTLVTLEHQDISERPRADMSRLRALSPRRRTLEVRGDPHAAPVAKPLAKPLVFRKTKRELEREQQQELQRLARVKRNRRQFEQLAASRQPKRARTLAWSCRPRAARCLRGRRACSLGGAPMRTHPRRRLLF